jgi:predicted glycosyltransferase
MERGRLKILIDMGHPGHVHLFRNAIVALKCRGHSIVITIRDRSMVGELLQHYGLEYEIASKVRTSMLGLIWELVEHDWYVLRSAVRHKVDLMMGTSVCITHAGLVTGTPALVFNEDDRDYLHVWAWLAYPFANGIVTPRCLRDEKTAKYICHDSLHELAYLHPDHFQPDHDVRRKLGVSPGERYFVVRFVALQAHHDISHRGLGVEARRRLVNLLERYGRVFISNEASMPEEFRRFSFPIPSSEMHHAMSFASLFVGDSQTMAVEAAVLGVPSIRCNTFHDRCSIINELENRYELTASFHPDEFDRMLEKVEALLQQPDLELVWQRRREKLLQEKGNFSSWIVELVESLETSPGRLKTPPER